MQVICQNIPCAWSKVCLTRFMTLILSCFGTILVTADRMASDILATIGRGLVYPRHLHVAIG